MKTKLALIVTLLVGVVTSKAEPLCAFWGCDGDGIHFTYNGVETDFTNFMATIGSTLDSHESAINGHSASITTLQNQYNSLIVATNYSAYSTSQAAITTTATGIGNSITIDRTGVYAIRAAAGVSSSGVTTAGARTIVVKVRKTSGTPADLTNASRSVNLPAVGIALTDFIGIVQPPEVIYSATAGDVLQVFVSISGATILGNYNTDNSELIAVQIR